MLKHDMEMILLRKRLPIGTLLLFHGSSVKSDLIRPISINAGTKLSPVRRSSFWTPEFRFAAMHIIGRYVYEATGRTDYILHPSLPEIYLLADDILTVQQYLQDKLVYVYRTVQPIQNLGVGHCKGILEYTLDVDVIPDKVDVLGYSEIVKFLIPEEQDKYKQTQEKIMKMYDNMHYSFMQNHLFYSSDELKRLRRQERKKVRQD